MNLKYGSLESLILNSLWELESQGVYKNSVKDVYSYINIVQNTKRAYTTVKTVMDRLVEKQILLRMRQGKKYFYRTAYSSNDIIANALKKIAILYCNNDLNRLLQVAQNILVEANEIDTKINIG